MRWTALLVLLFGLLLVGLTYFFYTSYKAQAFEGFQVNPNVYYVESDKFLDVSPTNNPTIFNLGTGYSTITGARNEFISILNDYKSYSGWQDRFATVSRSNTSYISRSNVRGVDCNYSNVRCRNTITYTQGNNILQFCDIRSNATWAHDGSPSANCPGYIDSYFMGGGFVEDKWNWIGRFSDSYVNSVSIYNKNNFNYINYVSKNSLGNFRLFLFNNQVFNTDCNINRISNISQYVLCNNMQYFPQDQGDNGKTNDVKNFSYATDLGRPWCHQDRYPYNMGKLLITIGSNDLTVLSNRSKNEEFRLNIYGDITPLHLSNFKKSQLFGLAFNFTAIDLIDLYLNVPFGDSNLSGNGYFSFGYFKQDVPSMGVPDDQLYKPNAANIGSNRALINSTPASLNIDNFNSSVDGVRNNSGGTNNLIGEFAKKITPEFLNILPNTVKQYVISWVYNRTITVLNTRLNFIAVLPNDPTNIHYRQGNINQRILLLSLALSNYKEASSKYSATGLISDSNIMSNWSNYLNTYAYANIRSKIRYDNLVSHSGRIGGDNYNRPLNDQYTYSLPNNAYYTINDPETAELIASADNNVVFWSYQKSNKRLILSYALKYKYLPPPYYNFSDTGNLPAIDSMTFSSVPTTNDNMNNPNNPPDWRSIGYDTDYISGSIVRNWKLKKLNSSIFFESGSANFVIVLDSPALSYNLDSVDGLNSFYRAYKDTFTNLFIRGYKGLKFTRGATNLTITAYYEYNTRKNTPNVNVSYYYATTEADDAYTYSSAQTYSNVYINGYDLYEIDRTGITNDQLRDIAEKNTLINSYTYTNDRCYFKFNFNGSNDNGKSTAFGDNTNYITVILNRKRADNSIGTTTPPLDSQMSAMKRDFTYFIQKLSPKYSDTANVNSSNFLNAFAQMYYEKSEGTEEPVFIYDVYRVDSNMVDIRFDSQRRMNSTNYRALLDTYRPQVERYNRLYDLYSQDTWQNAYSNISDLQFDLSNSLAALEPVLNPLYPAGNKEELINLSNANKSIMIQLSNNIFAGSSPIRSATTSSALLDQLQSINSDDNPIKGTFDQQNNWYFSTIAANDTLANLIGGFQAKVARAFITVDATGSNITLNSFAMGVHAATSYNPIYNAGIDTVVDSSQGNVNYQPNILYKYNVVPLISCSNIEFMRRGTQIYMDTVFTDLSGYTSNTYSISNGSVRVDKILGFQQINNNTCGFTWTESQYDYATNKKFISRTRNVIVPYLYDESIYQNPQLYIDNSNFRFTSNTFSFKTLEIPDSNIKPALDYYIAKSNENKRDLELFLSNIYDNTVGAPKYYEYLLYPNTLKYSETDPSKVIGINRELYQADENLVSNYNRLRTYYANRIRGGLNPDGYTVDMATYVNSMGTKQVDVVAPGLSLVSYGISETQTILDNLNIFQTINETPLIFDEGDSNNSNIPTYFDYFKSGTDYIGNGMYRANAPSGSPPGAPQRIQVRYNSAGTMISPAIYRATTDLINRYTVIRDYYNGTTRPRISYPIDSNFNDYIRANTTRQTVPAGIGQIEATVADDISYYYNILKTSLIFVENTGIGNRGQRVTGTYSNAFYGNVDIATWLKYNIIQPRDVYLFNKLTSDSNFYKTQVDGLVEELALNESNVVVQFQALGYYTIPRPMMQNTTLVDADGACPTLTCTDQNVMAQLLDQYNIDSNSPDKILRILKGVTPNKYQCDYLVEIRDKNSNVQQQTKSFLVGIDILDCSYYLASNVGPNTGYFIQDNTPFIRDSPDTDLSGFQYIGGAFLTYSNSVNSVLNPLIANAITAASNMYNAFTTSRLTTYDALGRMKHLQPTANCKLTYPALRNLFTTNIQFSSYIFDTYPFLDRFMSTIIRVAIYNENTIIVVFNEEDIYLSKNGSVQYGGITTTSAALYSIINSSEDTSCTYRAQYLSSTPMIIPPKEYMRSMLSNTHLLYANGYANILDNLNIKNKSKYINIEPLSKKTLNLVVDFELAQNRVVVSFKRAQKISCNEILYKIDYSTGTDIIYCVFKKVGSIYALDTITRYYTGISAIAYTSTLIPAANLTPLQTKVQSFYNLSYNLTPPITVDMIAIDNYSVDLSTTLATYFNGHGGGVGATTSVAESFKGDLIKLIGFPENPINYMYKYISRGIFSVEYVIVDPTLGSNLIMPIEDTNRIATFYFDILNTVTQNNLYSTNKPTNIYTLFATYPGYMILDIVADNFGYVYITDDTTSKVYYLTTPLEIVAGSGDWSYFKIYPGSNVEIDLNTNSRTIRDDVINPENRYGPNIGLDAHGITANSLGHIFVTDRINGLIRYIDTNTYTATSVAGTLPTYYENLFTRNDNGVEINRYTTYSQVYIGDTVGPALSSRLNEPKSIAANSKDSIYFIDQTNTTPVIKVYSRESGSNYTISRFNPNTPSFNPSLIRFDKYDNLYCIEPLKISKITPTSNYSVVVSSSIPIDSMALDSSNNLYYTDTNGLHCIRADSNIVYIPISDLPSRITSMGVDPTANKLYMSYTSNIYTIPLQSLLTYIVNPVLPNPTVTASGTHTVQLLSVVPATTETTSFLYDPTAQPENTVVMNYFRDYFNASHSIANGNTNNSILSRIYSAVPDPVDKSITYTVSVYHTNENGEYLTNRLPNDIDYNNTLSYTVKFLEQSGTIYNLTYSSVETPPVLNPVVDPDQIEQYGTEYYLPKLKYTNLRFTPISVNPIVDARIISAWQNYASAAPLYALSQLQFYFGETNIFLYTYPNSYNYLLSKANIQVPNPARIQTYQNYYKMGALQPNGLYKVVVPSIQFDLRVPTNLDGFSFVSGNHSKTSIQQWILEGSIDNGSNWVSLHSQTVPFSARNPVYPSAFYQTPIFPFKISVPLKPLPQIPAYRRVSGFTNYTSYSYKAVYLTVDTPSEYRINKLQFFDIQKRIIPHEERKSENKIVCILEEPQTVFGYSFITNSISSTLDPKSWRLFGSYDGSKWVLLDKKLDYSTPNKRLYQLPIFTIENSGTYDLPQPKSRVKTELVKTVLVQYYKEKINPYINPNFKKVMYDNDMNIYYILFDEYDLNRELIASDQIVGFALKNGKVKSVHLYTDEYGTEKPYDLSVKEIKKAWDRNVGLELNFIDF